MKTSHSVGSILGNLEDKMLTLVAVFTTMTTMRFFYHDRFSASFPPSSQFGKHLTLNQFNVAANAMLGREPLPPYLKSYC